MTYNFEMYYAYAAKQQSQNIDTNPTVIFQTGQVHSAGGHGGCTQYYSGGWRTFTNDMELLPLTYTFRYSDSTQKSFGISAGIVNNID